jgi:pimeloyl-ACP methyl ester carboxylesterase
MNWSPHTHILSWRTGCLLVLLLLNGCTALPDDEAAWVLKDLATLKGESRLKEVTPTPIRREVVYVVQGRTYRGDLYQPAQPPLATLVLTPGLVETGKNDPRLIAFATTLARARFLVLVPDLPNLRALKVRSEDVQGLVDAFVHLLSRPELQSPTPAGIGAFSYAVGLAVLAALEPSIRERVNFVLGIGGYYDLDQVVTFFTTGYFQKEDQWHYLEPNQYGKWVFVLSNVDRLRDAQDRLALQTMANRKLNDPQARVDDLKSQLTPEGLSVLNLLENREPDRTTALLAKLPAEFRAELDALNLAKREFSQLRARLILLHGTDDTIIPYTESMALATATPAGQSELFLIDGLAHVNVHPLKLDLHTSWRAIGEILAQRKDPGVIKSE